MKISYKKLWIMLAEKEMSNNVPTEAFFTRRKDRLIDYFKRIVENQKFSPTPRI